jgi:hypothetical protein
MKTCAFCRQPLSGIASSEHILPQWLLDEFGIRDDEVSPTHMSSDGTAVSTRTHQLKNLVAGGVCATCNSGWMSQLETTSRPILRDLFANEISVVDCSPADRFILARWATKTALTLNLGANFRRNIPKAHYHHLHDDVSTLPERTVVFAQNHHFTQDFYWLQGAVWMIDDPYSAAIAQEEIDFLLANSFKIAFQLRGLLLVIAFNPIDTFLYLMWRGIHVPLWPERCPIGYYDRDHFPWSDSREAIYSFHAGLGLVRKRPEAK